MTRLKQRWSTVANGDFHSMAPVGSLMGNTRLFLRIFLLERIPGEAPHGILIVLTKKENSDEHQNFLGCFRKSVTEDFWYWGKTVEIAWALCSYSHEIMVTDTRQRSNGDFIWEKDFIEPGQKVPLCLATSVGPLLSTAMPGPGFLSLLSRSLDLGARTSLAVWVVFSKTVCLFLDGTNNSPSACVLLPVERGHWVSKALEGGEENILSTGEGCSG